jgi:High potential iron-sulfur protein
MKLGVFVMNNQENSRRQFLIRGLVAVAAVPFVSGMLSTHVQAQALKPLTAANPQAVALKYVADAKKAVGAKPGSNCANCQLFVAATGGCAIFAGYAVAKTGWCSAWAKKA